MKKYRLIKGKPKEPEEEQILRNKDFERILANHERLTQPLYRTPLYKNPKVFLGLVLIAVIIWLIFSANEDQPSQQPTAPSTEIAE